MGTVACVYENSLAELFFSSMQIELMDRRRRPTRAELANTMFGWMEGLYNPSRRHPP